MSKKFIPKYKIKKWKNKANIANMDRIIEWNNEIWLGATSAGVFRIADLGTKHNWLVKLWLRLNKQTK